MKKTHVIGFIIYSIVFLGLGGFLGTVVKFNEPSTVSAPVEKDKIDEVVPDLHNDKDSEYLTSVINAFSSIKSNDIDVRKAACMISDLHESAIKDIQEELNTVVAEKNKVKEESDEIKSTFESYKEILGETDLYKTTKVSVQTTPVRPSEWKNTTNDHIAAVSPEMSSWLNKWAYISGIGIVFCCETCNVPNVSMVVYIGEALGEEVSNKDAVLLGQRVVSEEEIKKIQEMWNSIDTE